VDVEPLPGALHSRLSQRWRPTRKSRHGQCPVHGGCS
jgi:hypothetical protein